VRTWGAAVLPYMTVASGRFRGEVTAEILRFAQDDNAFCFGMTTFLIFR
jgi:hypothetical protein